MPAKILSFNIVKIDEHFWAHCPEDGNVGVKARKPGILRASAIRRVNKQYRQHIVALLANPKSARADCDFAITAIPLNEAREGLARHDERMNRSVA